MLDKEANPYFGVQVVDKKKALELLDISPKTWERLEGQGDIPRKTQLSPGRIGYRLTDIAAWLDARRTPLAASSPSSK